MIARLHRPLAIGSLSIALIARMNSAPTSAEPNAAVALGTDLDGSGPVIASPQLEASARTTHAPDQAASAELGSEKQTANERAPTALAWSIRSIPDSIR
jgi:hypothetical protein